MSVLELATEYTQAGLSVIPLRLDGSKGPADWLLPRLCDSRTQKESASWKPFQYRIAEQCELDTWFSIPKSGLAISSNAGIGLVCGAISGGLEVIDFDDGSLLNPWYSLVHHIAAKLPIVETPSGGWHVLYRCNEIGGNVKIACDPDREKQTLIETRGEGGYIVAEGSPCETHATGLPYCQAFGPLLPTVPRITPIERRELWAAARSFDRRGEAFKKKLIAKQTRQSQRIATDVNPVIAAFCDRTSWDSILTRHGWTTRDGECWTRPGKTYGVSARVVIADDGEQLLTVFSGNAGPLSPDGSHRTWNKFDAWAALDFNGNNREAFLKARSEAAVC